VPGEKIKAQYQQPKPKQEYKFRHEIPAGQLINSCQHKNYHWDRQQYLSSQLKRDGGKPRHMFLGYIESLWFKYPLIYSSGAQLSTPAL